MRYLFFDRILEMEASRRALAIKHVTNMDEFLPAHYELRPVMPSTLVIEALAQLAGWLHIASRNFRVRTVLGLFQEAHFHRPIVPGDQLVLEVQMLCDHRDGAELSGHIRVDGGLAAEVGRLMLISEPTSDQAYEQQSRRQFRYLTNGLTIVRGAP